MKAFQQDLLQTEDLFRDNIASSNVDFFLLISQLLEMSYTTY